MSYNYSADGLRGFAALNVVLAHFIGAFIPTLLHYNYPWYFREEKIPSLLYDVISSPIITFLFNGHLPVLIFFVLSGYVLSMPIRDNKRELLKKRVLGRYFRLNIPIVFTLIVSYILLKNGFYYNVETASVSGSTDWLNIFFYTQEKSLNDLLHMSLYDTLLNSKSYLNPPLWTIHIEFLGSLYLLTFFLLKPKDKGIGFELMSLYFVFTYLYVIHQEKSIFYMGIFLGAYLNYVKDFTRRELILIMILGLYFGGFQYENSFYSFLPEIKFGNMEIFDQKNFYNTVTALLITTSVLKGVCKKVI